MVGALSALLVLAVLSGWQQGRPKADATAFDSSSAEVKGQWTEIQAAAATNGYVLAITDCRKLAKDQSLTPEQRATLTATSSAALQQKLFDAAKNGDAAAAAAMEELRNVPR